MLVKEAAKNRNMNNHKTLKAWVVNGRKESRRRVFLLRHARIRLSWDTDEYLKLPIGVIREQIRVERERGYHKEKFGY